MWSVWLIFSCVIVAFIPSALWWISMGGLWKLPDGRDWLWGRLGLVQMCMAMLSKSLVQFSVDGLACVPFLLYGQRPNYGRGNDYNGDLPQKDLRMHCCIQCPWPHSRLLSMHATTGDSWTPTGKSGSVSCGDTAPFSWFLVHTRFFCALQESVFPVLWKFYNQIPLAPKIKFPGHCQSFCRIPRLGNLLCLFHQNVLIRSITIWTLLCSEYAQCLGLCSMKCVLSRVWLFVTHGLRPTRLLCPWDSPGKNTGVGCHFLL